ncbi:MAG: DNA alkylation repair protein [Chloroflexota bacterium]
MSDIAFKDHFNRESATRLGNSIQAVYPAFDTATYANQVADAIEGLELKARVTEMTRLLYQHLPADYETAVDILVQSLGDEHSEAEGMFTDGWYLMPVAHFVEIYGLDHFDASMSALNQITRRHTGEFAIRPFIERYPDQALATLREWVHSDSFHVRRLVSEGTRTRLPWASRLHLFIDDPTPVLELLHVLRDDPVKYVQKSVANNLNDLIKDHRKRITTLLIDWHADAPTASRQWIIQHASRNLLKDGDPQILAVLGYTGTDAIHLQDAELSTNTIALEDSLDFSYTAHNTSQQSHQILLDYVLAYRLKNGELSHKVFQIKKLSLKPDAKIHITKSIKMASTTTRQHYSGEHHIILRVNGQDMQTLDFSVTDS